MKFKIIETDQVDNDCTFKSCPKCGCSLELAEDEEEYEFCICTECNYFE